MKERKIARLINNSFWYIFSGLAVIICGTLLPRDPMKPLPMLFSGLSLAMIGTYGGALRYWKSERGLWMLAAVILATHGSFYLFLQFKAFVAFFDPPVMQPKGQNWQEVVFLVDSGLALIVFGTAVRLATSIAYQNWRISFPKQNDT